MPARCRRDLTSPLLPPILDVTTSRHQFDAPCEEEVPLAPSTTADYSARVARLDLAPTHRQPGPLRLLLATAVSLAGSLGVDAALVAIGTRAFPSTAGYTHFRFSDYAKLTVIGVMVACVAWPVVTRISWAPRWLFLRLAILVTLLLWLPDLYILKNGQPAKAVAILMVMHLAIALVTYNALVRIAAVQPPGQRARHAAPLALAPGTCPTTRKVTGAGHPSDPQGRSKNQPADSRPGVTPEWT
jgi:hypothetical protein